VPTDKQIDKYAQAHCILKEDIPEDIFDTMDRDLFINIIVEDALGKVYNWPMNCDSDEYKNKFYPLFYRKAIKKGIKVTAAAGRIACTTN
jgi:hypothetical protein